MNKEQIRRELRRSACEDENPWYGLGDVAFDELCKWKTFQDYGLAVATAVHIRTFYLLVAEAL